MDRDRKQKLPNHLKENAGRLVGWRFALLFGGFAGAITAFLYPMVIQPIINPESSEYWKRRNDATKEWYQKRGLSRDDLQPGGMKVWSDPWDRPGKPGNKSE